MLKWNIDLMKFYFFRIDKFEFLTLIKVFFFMYVNVNKIKH